MSLWVPSFLPFLNRFLSRNSFMNLHCYLFLTKICEIVILVQKTECIEFRQIRFHSKNYEKLRRLYACRINIYRCRIWLLNKSATNWHLITEYSANLTTRSDTIRQPWICVLNSVSCGRRPSTQNRLGYFLIKLSSPQLVNWNLLPARTNRTDKISWSFFSCGVERVGIRGRWYLSYSTRM